MNPMSGMDMAAFLTDLSLALHSFMGMWEALEAIYEHYLMAIWELTGRELGFT